MIFTDSFILILLQILVPVIQEKFDSWHFVFYLFIIMVGYKLQCLYFAIFCLFVRICATCILTFKNVWALYVSDVAKLLCTWFTNSIENKKNWHILSDLQHLKSEDVYFVSLCLFSDNTDDSLYFTNVSERVAGDVSTNTEMLSDLYLQLVLWGPQKRFPSRQALRQQGGVRWWHSDIPWRLGLPLWYTIRPVLNSQP